MNRTEAEQLTATMVAALVRGDRQGWVDCFHPDMEGQSGLAAMEGGDFYRGHEGAGQWFDNLVEVYESVQAAVTQTLVFGDHVVQVVEMSYVGRASGATLEPKLVWVAQIRGGVFVYARSWFDPGDGFRDFATRVDGASGAT